MGMKKGLDHAAPAAAHGNSFSAGLPGLVDGDVEAAENVSG